MRLSTHHEPARHAGRRAGRHHQTIGLDLGATAVRVAVLTDDRRSAVRLASVPLPRGAIVRGAVAEPQVVVAALRRLAAESGLRSRRVVVGVGTPQVVVRPLSLPAMPPEKLRMALPFQAREVLPIPATDAVLDFSPLPAPDGDRTGIWPQAGRAGIWPQAGRAAPSGGSMVAGLLTAAPRVSVIGIAEVVERAGLSVTRVDLASFGLLRSIGSAGDVVEALVDVGSELTTIVIHRHGVPRVVRVVAFGGGQLTDRLADALGVGEAEAEATKRAVGVAGDSMPALVLRDEMRPLLSEIRASLQYFVTGVGSAVDRILLTGGTSGLPGLGDLLRLELGHAVGVATPLRHVGGIAGGPPGRDAAATSAVSVGLALGVAA